MVGFQGPETRFITVPANSTRELNLKSGTYKWAFASKNAATISGYRTFEVNQRYDWNPLLD